MKKGDLGVIPEIAFIFYLKVVAEPGFEPGTQGFSVLCSTN